MTLIISVFGDYCISINFMYSWLNISDKYISCQIIHTLISYTGKVMWHVWRFHVVCFRLFRLCEVWRSIIRDIHPPCCGKGYKWRERYWKEENSYWYLMCSTMKYCAPHTPDVCAWKGVINMHFAVQGRPVLYISSMKVCRWMGGMSLFSLQEAAACTPISAEWMMAITGHVRNSTSSIWMSESNCCLK